MLPGLDMYYPYPAQRLAVAGEELDHLHDLDHDLPHM